MLMKAVGYIVLIFGFLYLLAIAICFVIAQAMFHATDKKTKK